jgi:arsenate reductase (thioredoxin)
MSIKPKVAFVCTHNSCRSQMAEAISKLYAADVYEAYSAGTEIKTQINPDAVSAIKLLYGVDMAQNQHPKVLAQIPPADVVITMGCGVQCPFLPCRYREDWGLVDPTGKPEDEFIKAAKIIETKVKDLIRRIQESEIQLN